MFKMLTRTRRINRKKRRLPRISSALLHIICLTTSLKGEESEISFSLRYNFRKDVSKMVKVETSILLGLKP